METTKLLRDFVKIEKSQTLPFSKYTQFDFVRQCAYRGAGRIGSGGHLILWDVSELETINDEYCVEEFMTGIFLIGSDGGGDAYGVNTRGEYITVPFIGMCNEDAVVIADTFDGFIAYIANLT